MNVLYWPAPLPSVVPPANPQSLRLNPAQICNHLIQDWLPAFASPITSNMFGWLVFLMEEVRQGGTRYWAVDERLSRTEKQWKGMLSWMLGVVGARQVLAREGYRWIAPVSAFYLNAPIVDLGQWPRSYPPTILETRRIPGSRITLTPDYLAIRSGHVRARTRWAAAEAKGTGNDLGTPPDKACPLSWRIQSQNLEVIVDGTPVVLDRHLVIATRINPGGLLPADRRIQIRAWNSDDLRSSPPEEAAVEIAAAHLFGLCLSLGLEWNALALSLAVTARHRPRERSESIPGARLIGRYADAELRRQFSVEVLRTDESTAGTGSFQTPAGLVAVDLAAPVISLLRQLRTPSYPDAVEALSLADQRLDALRAETADRDEIGEEPISGVSVRLSA